MKIKERNPKKKSSTLKLLQKIFNIYVCQSLISSVIIFVLGLVFLFNPTIATRTVEVVTSIILIVLGIGSTFNYFSKATLKIFNFNLLYGIVSIVLGLLILINPFTLVNIITIIFGAWLCVSGLVKVNYAFNFKKVKEDSWLLTFVIGILTLIFGIVVIVNPFINLYLTQVLGLFISIYAVLEFTETVLLKQRSSAFLKLFK
ncbi:MAG: DUF308 domain-containing protein [Bacilli bacterium]|nr:DUF308 domain-containing protein [Bacilli bacterium]